MLFRYSFCAWFSVLKYVQQRASTCLNVLLLYIGS